MRRFEKVLIRVGKFDNVLRRVQDIKGMRMRG